MPQLSPLGTHWHASTVAGHCATRWEHVNASGASAWPSSLWGAPQGKGEPHATGDIKRPRVPGVVKGWISAHGTPACECE